MATHIVSGIDGRIFPVSALESRRKNTGDALDLEDKFFPIQVKQKDKLGRPDVDAFEAMMMREEVQKGLPRLSPAAVSLRSALDEQIAHKLA